jgi:hypothetical protein
MTRGAEGRSGRLPRSEAEELRRIELALLKRRGEPLRDRLGDLGLLCRPSRSSLH